MCSLRDRGPSSSPLLTHLCCSSPLLPLLLLLLLLHYYYYYYDDDDDDDDHDGYCCCFFFLPPGTAIRTLPPLLFVCSFASCLPRRQASLRSQALGLGEVGVLLAPSGRLKGALRRTARIMLSQNPTCQTRVSTLATRPRQARLHTIQSRHNHEEVGGWARGGSVRLIRD